jgi:hypothetical protein
MGLTQFPLASPAVPVIPATALGVHVILPGIAKTHTPIQLEEVQVGV